ncbi:hypothetical protein MTY_1520 [Moorella thermoacetica Y72]|uniref:Uncharacterized protein n=1 Tax=Moorella thermoacetica Y72 TaxID=1325331 RepID=A0A0S6UBR9_NEOTH|nr:hypothetical protein MTY_1520 [Moorella thermoacetica Y72]
MMPPLYLAPPGEKTVTGARPAVAAVKIAAGRGEGV